MNKTASIATSIVLGTLLLTGCGPVGQTPGTSTNATVSNQTGAGGSANNGSGGSAAANGGQQSGSQQTSAAAEALVKESMTLAAQGKVIGIPFADQQNISSVQAAWGKPDSQDMAGAGTYATYDGHAAAFGVNKGEQIFDVRSFGRKIKTINQSDVQAVLGKPGETRHTADSVIEMYPAGADNQLLFVFPKGGHFVDHVSVFWPEGTVNLMAATQSAPSIAVDPSATHSGALQVTISNPPSGYRLVELEWVPDQGGHPVINTGWQINANAASGSSKTGFATTTQGRSYSFRYDASLRGQTGVVRIIYQDTAGAAIIGTSSKLTLK